MGTGNVQDLLDQLESKSTPKKIEALRGLGNLQDMDVVPDMIKVMMDGDETVWSMEKDEQPRTVAYHVLKNMVTIPVLLNNIIHRKYVEVRAGSAYLLGDIATAEASVVTALRNALQDPEERVRYEAMRALAKLGQLHATEVLPFLDADSATVRFAAVWAMGRIADPQVHQVLYLIAIDEDESSATRALAIKILGAKEVQEVAGGLAEMLLDTNSTVRQHAALALGRIGAFSALKDLYQTLIDPDEMVRYAVGVALGLMGDTRTIPFLLKAKRYGDQYIQDMAELAFTRLGAECLGELLVAMRKQPMPYRVDAIERIDSLRDDRIMLVFIQYLLDEQVYIPVRKALLNLGTAIVPPLIYVLEQTESSTELKEKSMRLLLDLQAKEAIPAMIALLEDKEVSIRELSVRGLGKLQATEAETALLKLIAKKDKESDDVIAEALLALGKISAKNAKSVLLDNLTHLNSKVRGYSISALGEIKDISVVPILIEKMLDAHQDNRPLIIQALAKIGDQRAIEPLLQVVKEAQQSSIKGLKGSFLGGYAVQALAKLGEPRVIRLLLTDWEEELEPALLLMGEKAVSHLESALVQEKEARVRALAAEGLGLVANINSMGVLIKSLQDTDSVVVAATAKALERIHGNKRQLTTSG